MNSTRKKLLIITTYFPPVPSVASQRLVSFVKYLSPEKYDIRVIAWSDDSVAAPVFPGISYDVTYLPNPQFFKRASFIRPSSFILHRIKAFYNLCLSFAGINEMSGWGRLAEAEVARTRQDWDPDVILATFPYAEALQIGLNSAVKFGIPMVADLRDGITSNSSHRLVNRNRHQSLEKRVVEAAKAVLTVSEPLAAYLKRLYPETAKNIHELRNGFDFSPGNPGSFNDVFTITYAGTFYGGRKPGQFFDAVKSLLSQGRIKKIRIRFPGVVRNFPVPAELESSCEFLPRMSYAEVIQIMKTSDALLLVLEPSDFKGVYSAKIFDYLGAMRPVIAIVDKSDVAARLILDSHCGFVAGWDDGKETEDAITAAYDLWVKKILPKVNSTLIESHHRKVLAGKLENILDELLVNHA